MKNHELFKFADIISDIIVDYFNGETEYESDREVLSDIENRCIEEMRKQSI